MQIIFFEDICAVTYSQQASLHGMCELLRQVHRKAETFQTLNTSFKWNMYQTSYITLSYTQKVKEVSVSLIFYTTFIFSQKDMFFNSVWVFSFFVSQFMLLDLPFLHVSECFFFLPFFPWKQESGEQWVKFKKVITKGNYMLGHSMDLFSKFNSSSHPQKIIKYKLTHSTILLTNAQHLSLAGCGFVSLMNQPPLVDQHVQR